MGGRLVPGNRASNGHLRGVSGRLSGYVADEPDLGWRFAITACGIFGMVYALPLVLLLRDAPSSPAAERESKPSPIHAVGELLSNFSFILLMLYFTLPAVAGWVVRDWMPTLLKARFQIGQGKAGVAATLSWQFAAVVGAFAGGWLADAWMRRHKRGRIFVSAIGMCVIVPALFGLGDPQTLLVAVMFLILFGLGWGFFDGNNMPILFQIVRPQLRATGYGIMNYVRISCGGLADLGFGRMDDHVPNGVLFGVLQARRSCPWCWCSDSTENPDRHEIGVRRCNAALFVYDLISGFNRNKIETKKAALHRRTKAAITLVLTPSNSILAESVPASIRFFREVACAHAPGLETAILRFRQSTRFSPDRRARPRPVTRGCTAPAR